MFLIIELNDPVGVDQFNNFDGPYKFDIQDKDGIKVNLEIPIEAVRKRIEPIIQGAELIAAAGDMGLMRRIL